MAKAKNKEAKFGNKPVDFILLITVLLLLSIGLVMVLSASSPSALSATGSSYTYFFKQAQFAVLGLIAMAVISKIDYRKYQKLYKCIYLICIVLLILVPIIGTETKGAKRWINIPGVTSFQPSELVKIGLIIFYSAWLTKYKDKLKDIRYGFFIPIAFLIPILGILFFFQDHLSACIVISFITMVMMLVAGSRLSHFLTFGTLTVTIAGVGMYLMAKFGEKGAFRLNRIISFLNPWNDPQDTGWQIIQSLYAIGSGGLFGAGIRAK